MVNRNGTCFVIMGQFYKDSIENLPFNGNFSLIPV